MKVMVLTILLILWRQHACAATVALQWDPVLDPDLHHYTLYQAERHEGKTGEWEKVKEIDKSETLTTVDVEDGKSFTWYVTATGTVKGESKPSNTVWIYEKEKMGRPACLNIVGDGK